MSDAADRLARTRLAIINQIQKGDRRAQRSAQRPRDREAAANQEEPAGEEAGSADGWFGQLRYVLGTWWRHHPAHMGLELATPVLSAYASRKPAQYLGIAAAIGALVVIIRPWRLISVTGLLVAVAKSSQLSSLVLSALSAADYRKNHDPYE